MSGIRGLLGFAAKTVALKAGMAMIGMNPKMKARTKRPLPLRVVKARRLAVRKAMAANRYSRTRISSPKEFDPRSFRTIATGSGRHKMIVGCPKGKFKGGKCKAGMEVQSVLRRVGKNARRNPLLMVVPNPGKAAGPIRVLAGPFDLAKEAELERSTQARLGKVGTRVISIPGAGYYVVQRSAKVAGKNPPRPWHLARVKEYGKLYAGDEKAGHGEAKKYWEGALAAEARAVASEAGSGAIRRKLAAVKGCAANPSQRALVAKAVLKFYQAQPANIKAIMGKMSGDQLVSFVRKHVK